MFKPFIISIVLILSFIPLSLWAGDTRQVRDTIIINNVKYGGHGALGQLDSLHYCALRDQMPFGAPYSWNFRGYVATWRISDNKLYLEQIEADAVKADFREILRDFRDESGRVYATWYSGTLICGTGPLLWKGGVGWDDLNETEIALTIESGIVVSSREYTNRKHKGESNDSLALQKIGKDFNYNAFPEFKGKAIPIHIYAARFDKKGRIRDWRIDFIRWPDGCDNSIQARLIRAIKKELNKYDWSTYCADGKWFWRNRGEYDRVTWLMRFK